MPGRRELSLAYRQALVDTEMEVLFEEREDGFYTGHTPNYMKVYALGEDLHNQIRTVRITQVFREGLLGEIQ